MSSNLTPTFNVPFLNSLGQTIAVSGALAGHVVSVVLSGHAV